MDFKRPVEATELKPGQTIRQFEERDLVGAWMMCPHCNQMLKVIEAKGPYLGFNYEIGHLDQFWLVTFSDGEGARFWEDNKGIIVDA